jgi:hypothetical protein
MRIYLISLEEAGPFNFIMLGWSRRLKQTTTTSIQILLHTIHDHLHIFVSLNGVANDLRIKPNILYTDSSFDDVGAGVAGEQATERYSAESSSPFKYISTRWRE